MRSIASLCMVILVIISLCTAFGSVGAISYDTVYVDDDGPSGGNHFTSLPTAYSFVNPGGTIHVAAGTYVLTSMLQISKDVAIIGAGADRVFIEGPVDTIALQVFNASLFLYGCTIRYAETGVDVHCTDYGDYGSYLHKNAIYGTTGGDTGISFYVSSDTSLELVITDNDIYDNVGYGVAGTIGPGAAADVTIEDNRIYDNGGSGIWVKGSECTYTFDFVGNEIWGNGEDQLNTGIALEIEEPDDGLSSFVSIENNAIYDNYGPGISFRILMELGDAREDGPLDIIPEFLHIFGNDIQNNNGAGIQFSLYREDGAIGSVDGNGIYSYIAGAAVINYNTIQANLGSGITVQLASPLAPESTPRDGANGGVNYDFFIEKNVITDNMGSGISSNGPFSYGIYNNLIARNGSGCGYGVLLRENTYGDVIHNTIVENGGGLEAPLMAGDTYLYNNIVANNLYFGLSNGSLPKAGDGNGEMCPVAYNDVWGNGSGPDDNYRNMPDLTGIEGNISLDPRFVSAMNLHLSTGSPCIDSGWSYLSIVISDDLEDTPRPLGMGFDMGCYEFRPTSWTPYILFPPAMTQLGRANAFWDCIKEQLPEDIADPAHAEALALVEEIQAVMARAGSLTNPVTINGLMNEAQALMAQLDALLQCGCS